MRLNVSGNQLAALPDLGRMTHLDALLAGRNKLAEVPASIGRLTRLQYLDLSDNSLTTVPSLVGLLELRRMSLANNKVSTVALPPQLDEIVLTGTGVDQASIKTSHPRARVVF